jgi:hypothetical protein
MREMTVKKDYVKINDKFERLDYMIDKHNKVTFFSDGCSLS